MNHFGDTLWASLPVPAFLLDPGDMIAEVNLAAEGFLNASARSLKGAPVFDKLAIDAPLEDAFKRVRADQAMLFINNVDVGSGDRPPVECNIQMAPMIGMPGFVLVLMELRQIADRLGISRSSVIRLLDEGLDQDGGLGFIFPEGSELRDAFDAALTSMMEDGTLDGINEAWGFGPAEE